LNFKKILVINPYGIGDVLFTTPVISNLRRAYPQARIAYLANRRTARFLQHNPDINQVFIYERDEFLEAYRQNPLKFAQKWFSFFNDVRRQGFEAVFDFSLNSTFGFLSAVCGIKRRVGFDYRRRGRFLTDRVFLSGYEEKHVAEYYLDLLRAIGIPVVPAPIKLDVPYQDIQWAQDWLNSHKIPADKPLIAVLPGGGASWGKAAANKRWPASKYAQLIDKIIENFDAVIILMGDSKEGELCREVVDLAHFPLYSAVGETSLLGLAALLMRCRGAIVNDGGPLHVAAAVGVKTVSIFGPVDPLVYGPYPAADHTVVQHGLPCQPCYRRFRQASCGHISCLRELSVEEVYRKVPNIL
jgi:lipopolysaccharide heptosyltransferase II